MAPRSFGGRPGGNRKFGGGGGKKFGGGGGKFRGGKPKFGGGKPGGSSRDPDRGPRDPSPAGGRRWSKGPDEGGRGKFRGDRRDDRGGFGGEKRGGFGGEKRFGGEKKFGGEKRFGGQNRNPNDNRGNFRTPGKDTPHPPSGHLLPAGEGVVPREGILYGINAVLEALRAQPDTVERIYLASGALNPRLDGEILSRASEARVRIDRVDRARLDSLAGNKHQGVVAEIHAFHYHEPHEILEAAKASGRPPLIVVLDGIQDPQNLGAIIRSAHAFGAHGVIFPKDRAAAITSVAAKASAGATSHTPIARVVNLARTLTELKAAGVWVVGAETSGDKEPAQLDLKGPIALVIGAEGTGIRQLVREHCDFLVRIPMLGNVASLNASVSAGVLLYETTRQRATPAPS